MAKQFTSKMLNYLNIPSIAYADAWKLQKQIFDDVVAGNVVDTFIMLEHDHTYTLGKVADKKNLIASESQLKDAGINVFEIDRGGDITYHGPGQIVGYPIINLKNWKQDTHKYLRALEEVIIQTCAEYNIHAGRNEKHTGVWINDRKIAAIGIKVSRWVTMHGFAFNVNTDLSYFNGIIPCGITDKDVTSLKKELQREVPIEEVKEKVLKNFIEIFEFDKIELLNSNIRSLNFVHEN